MSAGSELGQTVRGGQLASAIETTIAGQQHDLLAGLLDDDHTQYALLAGRTGGQTLTGGTAASENLDLRSTANATKGQVRLGGASGIVWDEALAAGAAGGAPASGFIWSMIAASGPTTQVKTAASNSQSSFGLYSGSARIFLMTQYGTGSGSTLFGGEARSDLASMEVYGGITRIAFVLTSAVKAIVDGTSGLATIPTGVNRAWVGGSIKTIQTDVGNVGGGEDDLHTYSLPAAMLSVNGQWVEIESAVKYAATANSKQLKVYFGATAVHDTGASIANGTTISVKVRITRTGATTQRSISRCTSDNALVPSVPIYSEPAETLANAITIKLAATGVADNDIVAKSTVIKWGQAFA